MLHLMKLAVGVRDIAHLAELQADRALRMPPLRHRTRSFPRRAEEITEGGSMYWIIAGAMVARQRILEIREDKWEDASKCTALILDPVLVPVTARLMKPFQGWRYLAPADAPADIVATRHTRGTSAMPPELQRALRELCLI